MWPHEMISGSSVAAVISDPTLPDTPIVACNDAFTALTGYPADEVIGRNCRFLRGPDTEPHLTEELRRAIREQRTTLVEIVNYRKDGTPFRNAVMLAPIFENDGQLRYILGSQFDVTQGGTPATSPAATSPAIISPTGAGTPGSAAINPAMGAARDAIGRLSPRQRDVLMHMTAGLMNKQIAYEMGISERTVKMHRAALLKALGCRTAAEAIRAAVEAGF